MTHFKVSWKIRFLFPTPDVASAAALTRRGQVADRTQTAPLTLPQTLLEQEGWKGLFLERDGGLIVLKDNEANKGNFLRFGSHGN